tara:strand:+ start:632 stop:1288 length:657 start_codon:yes stop_codon:yes gene_type:complete
MSDEVMESVETETTETTPAEKTFTQDELDRIVADRIARERKKAEKKLEGIDLEEARKIMQEREQAEIERQKERGEFENILKQTVEKKDQEITAYKQKLHETLVDGSLLSAASKHDAVSPDQVSQLLKGKVRLADDGGVEVLDDQGTPRYNNEGNLLSVDELVSDFLTANPHFVRASGGGTGSMGNAGGLTPKPVSVADMVENWNSGGREAFAAMKKAK